MTGAANLAIGGVVVAVVGVLVGSLLAVRASRPAPAAPVPVAGAGAGQLPPAMVDVLDVLRAWTVVLDAHDVVLRASASARAHQVVRGGRLVQPELVQLVREVRRTGETGELELGLPRGPFGGGRLPVVARVSPLLPGLILVLLEDRTESTRLDSVRRDFVANVSHELKTPVGALTLLAEAAQEAAEDPEAVRRFAGRMQHEANRLSHLVQELIDLSRLEGDDPLLGAAPVDLADVLAEAVDRMRLTAASRGIDLVAAAEPGLVVMGDAGQLTTAVRNLVDNAVSYSPADTRVAVSARCCGDVVEVVVTDQGIGIPRADLERIFERFYRVDAARSRLTGGTGLGLSIVKHVAANHGGEVTVWSVESQGSTFTLRLPAAPPELSANVPSPVPAPPARAPQPGPTEPREVAP